jgi:hypothetical protein
LASQNEERVDATTNGVRISTAFAVFQVLAGGAPAVI